MKFKILGSAAAEAVPALWCECENCRQAAVRGGKDIRRRTCYLIDEDTLVDFGPDIFAQTLEFGVDLKKIRRIVFTHLHEDHLNPLELIWRRGGFSRVSKNIDVFASYKVLTRMMMIVNFCGVLRPEDLQLNLHPISHAEKTVLDEGFDVIPFSANHAPGIDAHILMLERGGKRILIANDTGWPPENTLNELHKYSYDLVLIDGTMGPKNMDWTEGHMGAGTVVRFRDELQKSGCISPKTRVIVNHFSHNGGTIHQELEAFFVPKGIEVGFDGLTLEL